MSNNEVKFKKKSSDKPKKELSKRSIRRVAIKLYELTVVEGRDQRSRTRNRIEDKLKKIQFSSPKKEIWNHTILKTFIRSKPC
jgi:hypothetical protein